jgi:hypothetical protein
MAEARTRRIVRWPLLFDLEPVGIDYIAEAKRELSYSVDSFGDPAYLFDTFVGLVGAGRWMSYFVAAEKDPDDPEHVFETHFAFMRMRLRTLMADRPRRWIVRFESTSIPLATRMIEQFDIDPQADGKTRLSMKLFFDPHPIAAAVEGAVLPFFDRMFSRNLRRFGADGDLHRGVVPA